MTNGTKAQGRVWFVYSRYAGATRSGAVRGTFTSKAAAERFAAAIAPTLGEGVSVHVTTSATPSDPITGRLTLYV